MTALSRFVPKQCTQGSTKVIVSVFVGPAGCRPYNRFFPPSSSSHSVFKLMINKQPHSGDFSIATHILYIAGKLRTLSIIL